MATNIKAELRHALEDLQVGTLEKLATALREEPYVCVANWVNCSIDETKPVGCLFAAAYMHTDTFNREIADLGSARKAMAVFEQDYDQDVAVADALREDSGAIGEVIEWFDSWGAQSSKHREIEYQWTDKYTKETSTVSERVLTKSAQRELLEMIETIIKERA